MADNGAWSGGKKRGDLPSCVWDNGTDTDRSVDEEWPTSRLKFKTE